MAKGQREIAGDVLLATRPDGETLVQFSKTPFPVLTARSQGKRWQVEVPAQNKYYAGHGRPPQRLLWLYLPRMLAGQPPPKYWSWRHDGNHWRLENQQTGESIDGFFAQ